MQIYILIGEDRQGPYTPEELTEKLKAEECTIETLAWKKGMEGWQPLKTVLSMPEATPSSTPTEMIAAYFSELFKGIQAQFQPQPVGTAQGTPSPTTTEKTKAFLIEFFRGFRGLWGRVSSSPKPLPLEWYDRFWIVFGSLFLFWPLGVICVWLTKRFEKADKLRLTIAGVVWGMTIAHFSPPSSPRVSRNQTTAPSAPRKVKPELKEQLPDGVYLTQSGYLAGVSKEAMDRAVSYQVADDTEALIALIEAGLVMRLKTGIKVQLMETHFFSGLVEIRPVGSTIHLWTNVEAIDR